MHGSAHIGNKNTVQMARFIYIYIYIPVINCVGKPNCGFGLIKCLCR